MYEWQPNTLQKNSSNNQIDIKLSVQNRMIHFGAQSKPIIVFLFC